MRRLRQWQRHERMTVAMALAEATHHAAPRRQKPVSAIREVEEQAAFGHRRLLHRESGRASLRSLRRSAGESLPTLALSSLAGSAGEEMDVSTLLPSSPVLS